MTLPTDDARELIDRLSKLSIAATAPPVDDEQRQAWDALASALLTHRVELFDLAEEALLGRKARADTSLACCCTAGGMASHWVSATNCASVSICAPMLLLLCDLPGVLPCRAA